MPEEKTDSPRSALRLLGILDAVSSGSGALSLADLSSQLGAPKSSLLLILRPLVHRGYLTHRDGRYRLGSSAFRLASSIMSKRSFPEIIRGCMETLAEQTDETVYLAAVDRDAGTSTYVEGIESPQPVRYWVPIGTSRPLYCSAAGLCLLAHQDPAWREAYVRRTPLEPLTPRTQTDPDKLLRRLDEIQRDGLAYSVGEAVSDASGMAAPIVDPDGSVTMALLVAAPVLRFQKRADLLRRSVIVAAATASAALGTAPATAESAARDHNANAQPGYGRRTPRRKAG